MQAKLLPQRTSVFAFLALLSAAAVGSESLVQTRDGAAPQSGTTQRPAQRAGENQTGADWNTSRCRDLIGLDLITAANVARGEEQGRDTDQKPLGSVSDLVVDIENANLIGAIISSGGVAGIGNAKRLVPMSDLTFELVPAQRSGDDKKTEYVLRTSLDQARFDALPEFDPNQLDSLSSTIEAGSRERARTNPNDPQRPGGRSGGQNDRPNDGQFDGQVGGQTGGQDRGQAGGQNRGQAGGVAEAQLQLRPALVSELHGHDVLTNDAEPEVFGSIDSLIIDPVVGKVHYALISSGGFVGMGASHSPICADALVARRENRDGDGDAKLVLSVPFSRAQLEAAPKIDDDTNMNLDNPAFRQQVDAFYKQGAAAGERPPAEERRPSDQPRPRNQ